MSTRPILIDDHLLAALLRGEPAFRTRRRLATTGLWYHRLARALAVPNVSGSLSRAFGRSGGGLGAAALRAAIALPPELTMISLRELAIPMARILGDGHHLNLLGLEAVAAAESLGADLYLAEANDAGPLIDAAIARGTTVRIVPPGGRPSPPTRPA